MADPFLELVATLLMSLVPTLLFLGLYRGLEAIRDDDLINAWLADPGTSQPESAAVRRAMGLDGDDAMPAEERQAPAGPGTTRCRHCGRVNPDYVLLCAGCLRRL